jgi:hypothetical protein
MKGGKRLIDYLDYSKDNGRQPLQHYMVCPTMDIRDDNPKADSIIRITRLLFLSKLSRLLNSVIVCYLHIR